jgi:DNA-binding Lrp family transcriptional regulator
VIVVENIEPIVDKIKDLFVTVRYKYIKQNEDNGDYATFNSIKNSNHYPLVDNSIRSHLQHKSTYGIFCNMSSAKFITFDVDIRDLLKAKKTVLAIHKVLNDFGIPDDVIYTSISGNKGYHVEIYFTKEIKYWLIKKIYNATFKEVKNLLDGKLIKREIELRPSNSKGVKMPLGINYKNKDAEGNICWYIDVYNNFQAYKTLDFILSITKIGADIITDLIKDIVIESNSYQKNKNREVDQNDTEPSNIDLTNETPKTLKKLFEMGLTKKGTRNASTYKLAIYLNTLKLTEDDCRVELRKWMDRQDPKLYDTDLKTCYQEIDRCTDSVFGRNIVWANGLSEIEVSKSEILSIYQYDKKLHSTISALLFHSKRYSNIDNQFFMTYEQLSKATGRTLKTVITHIKILEKEGILKVIRAPIKFEEGEFRSHPNTYELNINVLPSENNSSMQIPVENVSEYQKSYAKLKLSLFSIEEIGNILQLVDQAKTLSTIK